MTDVTTAYQQAFGSPESSAKRAVDLIKGQKVVFVRGFLSDAVLKLGEAIRVFPDLSQIHGAQLPGQYFDAQMHWLQSERLGHNRVVIQSEAGIEDNAKTILTDLGASGDIAIVSHSKGCLDVLEMLLRNPGLWPRVKRWIAIQGPFHGTPVADFVTNSRGLSLAADFMLKAAGGSLDSLTGMRTDKRTDYLEKNRRTLDDLLGKIPTLCLATSTTQTGTFLVPTFLLINAEGGGPNDGLVPASSAQLKGTKVVELGGVDHAMPVMPSVPPPFNAVLCTQALLCALG